jgi:signal transduction histidine kinase
MDGMRRMAVGVAHDFNNILAAIIGNVSMVLRSGSKYAALPAS